VVFRPSIELFVTFVFELEVGVEEDEEEDEEGGEESTHSSHFPGVTSPT